MKIGFDDYDFETLITPMVLVSFSPALLLIMLGFNLNAFLGFAVLGVEIAAYIALPITAFIRNAGKNLESSLLTNNMPTTEALRARPSGIDPPREILRRKVEILTGIKLLSYKASKADQPKADSIIMIAVSNLKERMRDPKKFALLRRELKAYGYWRNAVAIVPVGRLLSSISIVIWFVLMLILHNDNATEILSKILVGLALATNATYWFIINEKNVLSSAKNYSDQFYKSIDII